MGLFELVERFASRPPTERDELEHALDVHLRRDPARSTRSYDWFHAELEAPVAAVTLRAPGIQPADGDTILLLDVSPQPCLSQHDVAERFGVDVSALDVPPPHAPSDAPLYLVYGRDWGRLAFGFDRQPPACLSSVVFTVRSVRSRQSGPARR